MTGSEAEGDLRTGPIKAIIFDMDGVLIDAKEWHYEALNRALGLFSYSISRYDHLVTFDGLPTRKKLEMLSLERGLPRQLHGFLNDLKQRYTMQLIHAHCKPVFQKEYALARLKEAGFKLAVASNSIRNTVAVMMDKAALAPYFDVTMSNQDVTRGKPDPEIYLKTMALLGVAPAACLIVEDNENGIKAATAAGAHVMVVKNVDEVVHDRIVQHLQRLRSAGLPPGQRRAA
jgi:beta-phosphoglucomutase